VIVSFADAATEDLYHGRSTARVRRLPADVVSRAERKLDVLNAAHVLDDLASPPGNRLEALKGEWEGHHSVRINDQWRIVFRWTEAGPADVAITDYHD
jgi:proteic killer suppression protein